MDAWFSKHPKTEREFQQIILRENNNINIANDTDYFIADIEYVNNEIGCRFDMLGVKWLSTSGARRNKENLKPVIIEVKYGDRALIGNAGLEKHIDDVLAILSDEERKLLFIEDAEKIFNQKLELGLVRKDIKEKITLDRTQKPEFLLISANHSKRFAI